MAWEGDNVVATGRKLIGQTKPADSNPATIRGDNALIMGKNIIHGSDSAESGNREIGIWFREDQLCSYEDHSDAWVYEK
eukprot:CAMPEP_0116876692 /NCGR_PEP_ID=MMETSP0463-20121206/8581_1 /TAXON_ID=181622 /ORGANISM="Strombidinopsis sp, Strain SopsisLIS2011" /LENGTH=78 /DNA_ID=CAMNT_0004523445 /DNA_START=304 /DNA_END=540 /DNA_ORIENTATION=+